ncbi:MAG: hypothetical protein E6G97_18415 [Alphaproteobacteria bacterium]|nr:MAG: hypothetical protein E6G97_18415 [Alphaproteobacteria bacterium]
MTLTVGTMTFDLSDPVSRLVAADALADAGRAVESRILRKTDQAVVVVPETGHVVRAEHDAPARKHKRIPRPGDGIQGNRRDERRKLGEIFRSKKWGGMFVVSESSALRYVSSDAIEDMDAWAEYPDGPGKYSRWVAVPVEETDKERKERETDETAKRSAEDEAAAKKKAIEATWSAVSAQHHIYSLPEGLIPASAWRVLSDERDAKFRSGNVRYIADLPDGGVVGHLSHRSYDDHQDHYYVPVSLLPVIEAAQAAIAVRRAREQETVEAYQADRAALVTEGCTEAAVRMAGCDEAAKTASTAYVESGDAATLDSYHEVLAAVARRITAERNAAYETALADWLPTAIEAIGQEAANELAAEQKRGWEQYSHRTDIAAELAGALESAKKEKAEAEQKAVSRKTKAAARKADPMVTVTGNTYPVREAIKAINGARWDAKNRCWRLPLSQVGRLPRGCGYEE